MRTFLLLLSLLVAPAIPTVRAAQDDGGKPLSLEQIKRLIQNDFPDTALAGEIRDRGIDFSQTFDRKTLEALRLLGAQEKTLRALEPYLPKAAVRVVTKLDRTIVLVDGKQYGTTDSTGVLQINDLEPGEHLIEVRNRPKYKDGQLRVVLAPRDNQEVLFEPELNVGSLTITPLTPNLEVVVYNELASLTGNFAKRELAPGIYTLQAKSRWYRPITQIIQINSGQHLTLPLALELDDDLIEETITEAKKAFSSKDYSKSVSILREVLTVTPRNLPALNLLSQNYLRLNDTPNFTAAAKRVLDADGFLDFPLLLHQEKKNPQPVRLRLARSSLTLEFLESGETQTLPLEAFSRAFIRGDIQSEVFLVLAGARAPKRTPDLQFSMANSYDPRGEGGENQLSQRDKISFLWNVEEIIRFSLEVHREFLAVSAPSREPASRVPPTAPASGANNRSDREPEASPSAPSPARPTETASEPRKDDAKPKDQGKPNAGSDTKKKDTKKKKDAKATTATTEPTAPTGPPDDRASVAELRTADDSPPSVAGRNPVESRPKAAKEKPPKEKPTADDAKPKDQGKPNAGSDTKKKDTKKKKDAKATTATTEPTAPTGPPDDRASVAELRTADDSPPSVAGRNPVESRPKAAKEKPSKEKPTAGKPPETESSRPAAAPSTIAPDMEAPKGAPSPVRARALVGTMIGAVGGRAGVERIAAAQFYGTQITVEPDLATPESAPDPKPIRQLWTRSGKLRFEVAPGSPTGLVFLRNEKLFWQRANGRVERITQPETLKQVRLQSKLAGVGLYQQLLLPAKEIVRFSRHLSDGQVEETVRITDADGDTYDVVIDLETRLPRKCAYQLPTAIGQPLQIEERYEDFRPVNNIQLPHRIIRSVQGGRTVTLTFTDIQFLPTLGDEVFRKP